MSKHSVFWRIWSLFHRHYQPTEWQRVRAQITPTVASPKPQVLINPTRLKAMARNMRTPQVRMPSLNVYLLQHGCTLPDPVRHTDALPPVTPPMSERPDDTGAFLLAGRDTLFDDVPPVSGPLDDDDAPTVLHPRTQAKRQWQRAISQLLPPIESE